MTEEQKLAITESWLSLQDNAFWQLFWQELLRKKDTLTQAIYEYYFENQPGRKDNILKKQFDSAVKIIEKLIEIGVDNGEFYCEDCQETARNIMFVVEGMKISAQTIGITSETVDREILYILKSLGVETE